MHASKSLQIRQTHAPLIYQVVRACHDHNARSRLDLILQQALQRGWDNLVIAIRRIVNGERDDTLLLGLDEEDSVIVRTILDGLADPSTLPDPASAGNAELAAPGLAIMLHQAIQGDRESRETLEDMIGQMAGIPGDMTLLAEAVEKLLDGERRLQILDGGLSNRGRTLLTEVLTELGKLTLH